MNHSFLPSIFLIVSCLWFCALPNHVGAQAKNLYDLDHSLKFANYLYQNQEFRLAAEEYERIIFMDSSQQQARLQLIQSYRKSQQLSLALHRLKAYRPNLLSLPVSFATEYAKVLLLKTELADARSFLAQHPTLPHPERRSLQVGTELLAGQWKQADSLLQANFPVNSPAYPTYRRLTDQGLTMRRKSPALSLGLSALVPGLGKAYSGYWKDGIFSLLFTGVAAWQSYRGFNKQGVKSPIGWIFAGIGGGFYIGNLYGSAKAAKRKNQQRLHDLHHETEQVLFQTF
jgi:hypothetical protein